MICLARGQSTDGRLIIDSDTTTTLILDGLQLTSREGCAISFPQKQKTIIVLGKGSENTLTDAEAYTDSTDTATGCLYSRGPLIIKGEGLLTVSGHCRHAIASGKNITVESGTIAIADAAKSGLHCDKFTMRGRFLSLSLSRDGSKGIKCKESLTFMGGHIEGEATGGVVISDGETTYCSLLKSNGDLTICNKVEVSLTHRGTGGRCLSVDGNLLMTGGTLTLENHGNGGSYQNAANSTEYFTPKCITVNGLTRIERGQLSLLATGMGGKGLDCTDTLFVGRQGDGFLSEDSLLIEVETRGWSIIDNVDEDYRRGCPKAIKSDNDIFLYSGTRHLKTSGQGGEGIETKNSLRAYNSTIMSNTFDDGINTGTRCYIDGAHIFSHSTNNDGIDSNGKISILNGVVAAISEHPADESFDTNGGKLNIYGGLVIGIGCDDVMVSQMTDVPYYSTPSYLQQDFYHHGDSIAIQQGRYLSISNGKQVIVSLYHEKSYDDAFITMASPLLQRNETYTISDGEKPSNPHEELFNSHVCIGGELTGIKSIFTFTP